MVCGVAVHHPSFTDRVALSDAFALLSSVGRHALGWLTLTLVMEGKSFAKSPKVEQCLI